MLFEFQLFCDYVILFQIQIAFKNGLGGERWWTTETKSGWNVCFGLIKHLCDRCEKVPRKDHRTNDKHINLSVVLCTCAALEYNEIALLQQFIVTAHGCLNGFQTIILSLYLFSVCISCGCCSNENMMINICGNRREAGFKIFIKSAANWNVCARETRKTNQTHWWQNMNSSKWKIETKLVCLVLLRTFHSHARKLPSFIWISYFFLLLSSFSIDSFAFLFGQYNFSVRILSIQCDSACASDIVQMF